MPEVAFDREFLHRCCVQFSIPLEKADVQVECNHALNFVRQHGHEHPLELSRALIWRVTDAEDPLDRSGAWRLLNAVILCCSDTNDDLFKTKVLSKIHPFMHYLIAYRWFTLKHRRDKNGGSEGKKESSSPNAFSVDLSKTGAIISAEAFRGVPPEISALTRDQVVSLQNIYGSILSSWKTVFSAYVYYELKERVRSIERNGNDLSASAEKYLEIPNTFKDSLWRLRRQEPNPAAAWHVLRSYGWYRTGEKAVDGEAEELRVRPASLTVPSSVDEVSALDPSMHPTVLKWAMKVIAFKGGCRMCNTWKHCEWACPCERPFVRFHADESNENQVRMFRPKRVQPPRYHKLDAVDVLYKYDIKLPLRVDSVLDAIVKLIQSERSYDDVVDAFDAVRGAVTGPLERHALWLHASHQLKPSATLFQKPSDEDLSPAMQKAKEHLYKLRRYRDWKELLGAVEVLDGPFRRHSLPPQTNECIKEIRETSSFAFCLIDGTLPPSYTPAKYARVPEEVMRIAPIKDILCRSCLEPFHSMSACPHRDGDLPIEDWDMRIAKETLMEYDLVTIEWPEQMYRIDAVLEQIDADDRMAKDSVADNLAVKIILVDALRCAPTAVRRATCCATASPRPGGSSPRRGSRRWMPSCTPLALSDG
ncbi:hypothetical protein AGDE_11691 [Angomonas deanei]|nr:hypothetical protein AGDE_11691 [Angomonas deanei]|eukprot:EPY25800.1 hypothetical protein AGDE_11691 [Angomonas deanei]